MTTPPKTTKNAHFSSVVRPPQVYFVGAGVILLALISLFIIRTCMPVQTQLVESAAPQQVNRPLVISLGQKLRALDTSRIGLSPAVEGSWQYKPAALLGNDQLVFTPKDYFHTATTYTVTFPDAPRLVAGMAPLPRLAFTTENAPSLTSSGLTTLANNATIAADYEFRASLSAPNRGLRGLELKTTPAIEFVPSDDDTTFVWKPKTLLPQGKKLTFELFDRKNNQSLLKRTITVAAEPQLASDLHRSYVGQHDTIDLVFSQPIVPTSADIHFSLKGKGDWRDDKTYRFTPDTLAPGASYTYTVAKNLRSKAGGLHTKPINGSFSTVGPVSVTQRGPWGQDLAQAGQTISFSFDQPVDHASAQSHFSVSSGSITGFSWSGNTMNVGVKNLGYQHTVSATISPGIKNSGFGLPSTRAFSVSFTTEARSRRLAVPYYYQQHSATCAVASLRMILAYYGISTSEMTIVNRMGYAPTKMKTSTNPPTWDDPQQMFVGSVDGSLSNGTAAGPDAPPVARTAQSYGRGASAVTGISSGWIAQQIYDGHPVAMFGAYRNTGFFSWKTPSGRIERMNLSSHVVVVTGVVGEPSAPIGFWVNDPLAGGTAYWSADAVAANISLDAYRQAVVVY